MLLFVLLIPLSVPRAQVQARAEGERYAVAAERNVWFYSEASEGTGLFILPYTYYVKVVSEGEVFCAVEYLYDSLPYRKLRGYCKKSALTFVDFVPVRPGLLREVTISYNLPAEYGALGNGNFKHIEQTFVYYGHRYEQNSLYFYVAKDGIFDYVPATEELTYELNTDYLPPPPEENEPTAETGGISTVHVVVICLVCAAAVVIAVSVMRGKRPSAEPREASDF
ncbi:MAG: hypothetical protein K2N74_03190 [Clostridiales bacterium]|nr:hypothetical protein [Clostridiales bacterium]